MKTKILADLRLEDEAISKLMSETKTRLLELERAIKFTERDLALAEGRQSEVKGIINYLEALDGWEEKEELPEILEE